MKKKIQPIKIWITAAAVLLMGSLSSASVCAQDYDSSRNGSITINLIDLDTEFTGVVFTCYKVADVDTGVNLTWDIVPELEAAPVDLNELENAEDYQDALICWHRRSAVHRSPDSRGRQTQPGRQYSRHWNRESIFWFRQIKHLMGL